MPTYKTRGAAPVTEHGIVIGPTVTTLSDYVLTEARLVFSDSSSYDEIGETVTETDSGITGTVFWNRNNTLGIINVSGEFVGSKVITGAVSGATETPTAVENLLNQTAATPVYSPLLHSHALTSTGAADDQTVKLDGRTTWVMITTISAGVTLSMYNVSTSYPVMVLSAGQTWLWKCDVRAYQLVFDFSVAGTCNVFEFATMEERPIS